MTFLPSAQNNFEKWLKEKENNPQLELEFRLGYYHPHKKTFISNLPEPTWLKIKNIISKNENLKEQKTFLSIQCHQENIRKETFFIKKGKDYIIDKTEYLIKKKVSVNDFYDEGIRFSVQQEIPVPKHYQVEKVCFQKCNRLKNRTQFIFNGFVIDMTQVKQTQNNECIDDFIQIINENNQNNNNYNQFELEIEVENKIPYDLITDIKQIIQSNKNINSNKLTIPNYLRNFIRSKTNQVIGLKIENIPTISQNYSITDKADGERYFLFAQNPNQAILFNKHFHSKIIHFNKNKNNKFNDLFPFCVEGEYLRIDGKPNFFIFDIFLLSGSSQITSKSQLERIEEIKKLLPILSNTSSNKITLKKFYFYNEDFGPETKVSLYEMAEKIWEKIDFDYHLDGLIFTPQLEDYYGTIYKWKPPQEKSIDFFIKFEGTEPFSFSAGLTQQILHLSLYVSLSRKKDIYNLLNIKEIEKEFPQYKNSNTLPILFQNENKMILGKTKLICNIKEINGFPTAFYNNIPILHQTVIEFIYHPPDGQGNGSGPWIPIKVRRDKTQDFLLGVERGEFIGPNSYKTAIDTWKGINEEFPLALLKKL